MRRRRDILLPSTTILFAMIGLVAICVVIYLVLWAIDFAGEAGSAPWALFAEKEAVSVLNGLGEVTVGVLGAALTVVAIIVELSAHRYTPRVTDLFIRDPVNVTTLGFYVLTSVLVFWVNMSFYGATHPTTMVMAIVGMMSLSLLSLLPYFAYVFDFLSPTKVVMRITVRATQGLDRAIGGNDRSIAAAHREAVAGVEQLGDMVLNSVDKNDKAIAVSSLNALSEIAEHCLKVKSQLPDAWFSSSKLADTDQDFVALHKGMVKALETRRTWLEMKILRQYQAAFAEAITRSPDITHLIAMKTKQICNYALVMNDMATVTMCMRFMNTYMRATLNARDIRSAYNTLNEYRLLGEAMLVRGYEPFVVELAGYLKFYGQLAFNMKQSFILEVAAYDIETLVEAAHKNRSSCHDSLLEIFLDVDREPEGDRAQETALRGVRKAQVKAATHYLMRDDLKHARMVWEDMRDELPTRLTSIREELEGLEEAEYWEVVDRGTNFDYLPPERKALLAEFFRWFEEGPPGDEEPAGSDEAPADPAEDEQRRKRQSRTTLI